MNIPHVDSAADSLSALAEKLLDRRPSAVPRFLILRDIVGLAASAPSFEEARAAIERSPHVIELVAAQLPDGTWGRFHSQDASAKARFPTTEYAIERGLALGLDADSGFFQQTVCFLGDHLAGRVTWIDRAEKHDNPLLWEYNIKHISAAYLALLVPQHPALIEYCERVLRVAQAAFASGSYDRDAETRVHAEIAGFESKRFRPSVDKYALMLLSALPGGMPADLEDALTIHVLNRPDGIYYSYPNRVCEPPPIGSRMFPSWLNALELLARFRGWPRHAAFAADWIWQQRNSGGFWDFGAGAHRDAASLLSDDWRDARSRVIDCSVRVLAFLRRTGRDG